MRTRVVSSARALGAALLACAAATVIAGAPASAAPYPPTEPCALSVDSATLTSDHTLTVTGSGLGADLGVAIRLQPISLLLGAARTDDNGGFIAAIQVPATLRPGAYLLVVSTASAWCQLPTTAPGPTGTPGGGPTSGPGTGPGTGPSTSPATRPTSQPPTPPTSPGSSPSSHPTSPAPGASSPERTREPAAGPILLTLGLIALLVVGGSALMLVLTSRRRT